jgi:hypothetical protein
MPDWRTLVRSAIGAPTGLGEDEPAVIEELAQHLEDRYDHLLSQGWSEREATAFSLSELDTERLIPELSAVFGAP